VRSAKPPPGVRITQDGAISRWEYPSAGPERDALRKAFASRGRESQAETRECARKLRALVGRVDPIHLLSQLVLTRLTASTTGDDTAETFGHEAKLEFIMGLALSFPVRAERRASADAIERAWSLADDVFQAAGDALVYTPAPDASDPFAAAQFMARVQYLTDRTEGFVCHQERLMRAAFARIGDKCRQLIGFDPADLPTLIRTCHRLANDRVNTALHTAAHAFPDTLTAAASLTDDGADWFVFTPDELHAACGIASSEIRSAFDALSCGFGCQPDFLLPVEPNLCRRRPAIPLDDDKYFMALLWTATQEFVPWFIALTREANLPELESLFLRERDRAAELLVRDTLAQVFGSERVRGPVPYTVGAVEYEVDALVELPGVAIVAETKAHLFSDSARRGSPDRLRRHQKEIVDKALEQGARAAENFKTEETDEIIRLAVSFERIDSLSLAFGVAAEGQPQAWVLPCSDLLMVAEILNEPAAFLHYARIRARWTGQAFARGFMEADFLGAYLDDRMLTVTRMADEHPDYELFLGYSAAEINEFFSGRDVGIHNSRPTTRVPDVVTEALGYLLASNDPAWRFAADAVMNAPASAWEGFPKAWRKVRAAGKRTRVATATFQLPTSGIALASSNSSSCFGALEDLVARPGIALGIAERQGSHRERRAAAGADSDGET
jgi:hypothetical protein